MRPNRHSAEGETLSLARGEVALDRIGEVLEDTAPRLEIEIGFGTGMYLLRRSAEEPETRFLGIESAPEYYELVRDRARASGLDNLSLIRGEALYVISTHLPARCADALHIYFPDPWPKTKHRRRRLLDPASLDLVLSLLKPGAHCDFATDHADYGRKVEALLLGHPGIEIESFDQPWPDGARTNYEAKYLVQGRPIRRLRITLKAEGPGPVLHPAGRELVVSAY